MALGQNVITISDRTRREYCRFLYIQAFYTHISEIVAHAAVRLRERFEVFLVKITLLAFIKARATLQLFISFIKVKIVNIESSIESRGVSVRISNINELLVIRTLYYFRMNIFEFRYIFFNCCVMILFC